MAANEIKNTLKYLNDLKIKLYKIILDYKVLDKPINICIVLNIHITYYYDKT